MQNQGFHFIVRSARKVNPNVGSEKEEKRMKRLLVSAVASLLWVAACHAAPEPKEEPVPKASDGWPMVLLDEPFHIGDQVQEGMRQPKAMGKQLVKGFVLDKGTPSLYVGVWLTSTVGPGHKEFKKGHYQIKLLVNGKEIEVLNKRISRKRKPGEAHKVIVHLGPKDVQKGVNDLTIKGGTKGENISECEIHKVVLSLRRP